MPVSNNASATASTTAKQSTTAAAGTRYES